MKVCQMIFGIMCFPLMEIMCIYVPNVYILTNLFFFLSVKLKLPQISADHHLWDSPGHYEVVGAGDCQSLEDSVQSLD